MASGKIWLKEYEAEKYLVKILVSKMIWLQNNVGPHKYFWSKFEFLLNFQKLSRRMSTNKLGQAQVEAKVVDEVVVRVRNWRFG